MSLDVSLHAVVETRVYDDNITHNLGRMAEEAGLYTALWRPEECNWTRARMIKPVIMAGFFKLISDPERFRRFDAPNGWGRYEHFVEFVKNYLAHCAQFPDAKISVSR